MVSVDLFRVCTNPKRRRNFVRDRGVTDFNSIVSHSLRTMFYSDRLLSTISDT